MVITKDLIKNWAIVALGLFSVIMLWINFRKPHSENKDLRDSVKTLLKTNQVLESDNNRLYTDLDSLESVKSKIKVSYKDRVVFIQSASGHQIDSIIRACIK